MKILRELLRATGFDSMLVATFGADLPWFESLLLRTLRSRSLKRLVILMDDRELSSSLSRCIGLLRGAGRAYSVYAVRGVLSFHPKLILMAGKSGARLYVGSGNLTRGGLDSNLEVFDRWDADLKNDGVVPDVFRAARDFVEAILAESASGLTPEAAASIRAVLQSPVFEAPTDQSGVELWASPGPLVERLEIPGSSAETLQIASPYFDEDGEMTTRLATQLRARSFEVVLDARKTNLTRKAATRIAEAGGRLSVLSAEAHPRPMHGKAIFARGPGWALGISGSANASRAAWQGSNAELVVVRRDEAASDVEALFRDLQREPLVDVNVLPIAFESPEDRVDTPEGGAPRIVSAAWDSLRTVSIRTEPELAPSDWLELSNSGGTERLGRSQIDKRADQVAVRVPEVIQRGEVLAVRAIRGSAEGPWSLVFDPEELADQAEEGRDARRILESLLSSETFDPGAAIELNRAFAEIHRSQREARKSQSAGPQADNASQAKAERDEIRSLSLADFVSAQGSATPTTATSVAIYLSVRLMKQLLFGSAEGAAGGDEGESDLDEDSADALAGQQERRRAGDSPTARRQARAFLDAAAEARKEYLENIGARPRPAAKLLDDLQLLAAPLFYMLKAGAIDHREFLAELVPILREMLGASGRLQRALERLADADRADLFQHHPAALLCLFLVYNCCAAHYERRLSAPLDATFGSAAPALWLSRLISVMPEKVRASLVEAARANRGRLRYGIFWLQVELPQVYAAVAFEDFVEEMVEVAAGVPKLRAWIEESQAAISGAVEDQESIVALLGEDELGAGWPEENRTIVRRGAFEGPQAGGHVRAMVAVDPARRFSLEAIKRALPPSERRSWRALRMLERAVE